jgi:hypothetical protein
MEYLPSTLKLLHLGVAGLGLYVSIEGQLKIWPGRTTSAVGAETTDPFRSGFYKYNFVSAAYIVTVVALLQLAVLYYYHDYGGKESHFRLAYLTLALINLIFGSFLISGAVTLLDVPNFIPMDAGGGVSSLHEVTGVTHDIAMGGVILGALIIAFNFVNLYHAGYAIVGKGRKGKLFSPTSLSAKKRHSPRRKK